MRHLHVLPLQFNVELGRMAIIAYSAFNQSIDIWLKYSPIARETDVNLSHIKDSKVLLDAYLLNSEDYKGRIKGRRNNPSKGVAPLIL